MRFLRQPDDPLCIDVQRQRNSKQRQQERADHAERDPDRPFPVAMQLRAGNHMRKHLPDRQAQPAPQ